MSLIENALRFPVLIAYVSGANNYSYIHFRDGRQLLISKSLSLLETKLPQFCRVHKTVLVNPLCISELRPPAHSKTPGSVLLENGEVVPVSRRRWPDFIQQFQKVTDEADAVALSRQGPLSILFVSDDLTRQLLLEQLIADRWPDVEVTIMHKGGAVPDLLMTQAEADRPALILLDVGSYAASQLALLQRLKESSELRRLPVVLLLTTGAGTAETAYELRANSVLTVSSDKNRFVDAMQQVCQYWLSLAALPQLKFVQRFKNETPFLGA